MNKFTLKFQNRELEQQYQDQLDKVRYPLFASIAIMSIIIFGLLFVIGLVNNQIDSILYLNITIAVGYLITLILTCKNKFFISPCMILLLQVGVIYISYPYRYHPDCNIFMTTAQCYFTFYIILGFIIEFIFSIIGIFLTAISIITVTLTLELQFAISGILIGVGLIGFFCLCRYYLEWLNRQAFLLTLKDKQWEQIIKRLIKKPFILFEFDSWSFGFNLKLAGSTNFKCENTQELREFLRESKIKDKNLEQYLFNMNQQKSSLTQIENELNIIYQKKQITIQIFVSTIIQNQFLILVDENTDIIKQLRTENQQNKKQLVLKFVNFLHQLLQMLNQAVWKQKYVIQILQQLNACNLYQQLFLVQELQNEFQTISLESLITILNNKIFLKSFYTRFAMNNIQITTIPSILVLLIQKLTRCMKARDIFLFIQYPSQQEPFYIINLQEKKQQRQQSSQFNKQREFEVQKELMLKQLFAKIAHQVRIISDIEGNQEKIIQIFMIYKQDQNFIL